RRSGPAPRAALARRAARGRRTARVDPGDPPLDVDRAPRRRMSDDLPRVLAVIGPTASGKSRLAVELAERLSWPVLCCDSVQVYRGLDIGSAKVDATTRERVPHFLLDLVDPDQDFS